MISEYELWSMEMDRWDTVSIFFLLPEGNTLLHPSYRERLSGLAVGVASSDRTVDSLNQDYTVGNVQESLGEKILHVSSQLTVVALIVVVW